MKLHPNWTESWKWLQTQLGAVVVAAPILHQQFPQYMQEYVSPAVFHWTMAGLGAAIILNSVRAKG